MSCVQKFVQVKHTIKFLGVSYPLFFLLDKGEIVNCMLGQVVEGFLCVTKVDIRCPCRVISQTQKGPIPLSIQHLWNTIGECPEELNSLVLLARMPKGQRKRNICHAIDHTFQLVFMKETTSKG